MNPGDDLRALRRQYRTGRLHPAAVLTLDRVAPGWKLDDREHAWRTRLAQYGLFLRREGRPPSSRGGTGELQLYRWLRRQRDSHADGRLDAGRRRLLDRVPGHTW